MTASNPIIPPGSPLHKTRTDRQSRLLVTVLTIVAVHVTFLAGLLIQGCKREGDQARRPGDELTNMVSTPENSLPTNLPPEVLQAPADTNVAQTPVLTPAVTTPPAAPTPSVDLTLTPQSTSTPSPTATAPKEAKEYKVARGDTFTKIAKANGVSFSALKAANPQVDPTKIKVGQKLKIPAAKAAVSKTASAERDLGPGVYVVKSGDTLTRIAKTHGTTAAAIRAANGLKTDRLLVGQKLRVSATNRPAATTAPSATDAGLPPLDTNAVPQGGATAQ